MPYISYTCDVLCVSVRVLSHLHPNATGPDIITIYYAYTLYDTRARSLSPKKMRQAVNNMCSSAGTSWSEEPNSDHDLSTVICTNASARRRRHRSIGRWRVRVLSMAANICALGRLSLWRCRCRWEQRPQFMSYTTTTRNYTPSHRQQKHPQRRRQRRHG